MNRLLRHLAPISEASWDALEEEVSRALKTMLAGRRVVDFTGPLGETTSSISLGRLDEIPAPPDRMITARLRRVQPIVEFRVVFDMARSELEAIDRGAKDPDFDPAIEAARQIAMVEDHVIFHGYPEAGVQGIVGGAAGAPIDISDDYEAYPKAIAEAISRLRDVGVDEPYALVLSDRCYTGLTQETKGGYPVMQHVKRVLDGPIFRAAALSGAVVLSLRGGDFEHVVGQDLSIGYLSHDAKSVKLYIEESLTFRLLTPEAAVPLSYPKSKTNRRS
ncbi:MAG: bacteriocin [Alphaproteobacteria bacterium]|nr:bacteriocin [Alphaproteobacteria bacterium]